MKILYIGDIVGRIGRQAVGRILPGLKKKHRADLVVANAENSAHGSGLNENIVKELNQAGVDIFSLGDHAFSKEKDVSACFTSQLPVIRPANYPPGVPGQGVYIQSVKGENIAFAVLAGRVFMDKDFDCPFRVGDMILANLAKQNISAIILEVHAEASSEKIALRHYFNGRVAAVLGTHTHVMTADSQLSAQGTAYITDIGMTGADEGVIGVDKENILKSFLTQIKYPHVIPEKGQAIFNAVLLNINLSAGRALSIKPIRETREIH
ncbi:metallophosphoesterase [Candidatus Falkowbacteria bacterium CG_4_10_14_0_2_um_filter_48_10]|uniref:Metallophosphoesterase n=1 Tax=Candidatus Falkowbacteria bacterium CG23_combo_of_CG06-09_8_20_14_all_49_15 TaxID=1974572 RepID=A0A2G9ZMG9_9BACT|nr:MAG: metallophosphoesterase [Candidatus Falkowbacteria bacterium CG23_combo_of_CG06-09_8_20_14_all_49_15]PJA08476.1 MAG: metallophosphoesterase [Candidatus Falkowbacteria bacterium CG_4_10_14_0_2_um_filter_48_10]